MEKGSDASSGSVVMLTRLARQVYRHSPVELVGLTLKEMAVLSFLRDHASAAQQLLSEAMCLDANNCVLLLNDLEESGYVERRRDPSDRRRHLVELTPEGIKALQHAEQAQESVEDEVLGSLDPAERQKLHHLLSKALAGND
jgi:DNA-binding MarR family transcriptional regulator